MNEDSIDQGVVTRLENGRAFVSIDEQSACKHCGAKILCAPGQSGERGLMAKNTVDAKVGDYVTVAESGQLLLKISAMQFGLPLLGFLVGIFLLYFTGFNVLSIPPEVWMFLGGLAGLGITSLIARQWANRLAETANDSFIISNIIQRG